MDLPFAIHLNCSQVILVVFYRHFCEKVTYHIKQMCLKVIILAIILILIIIPWALSSSSLSLKPHPHPGHHRSNLCSQSFKELYFISWALPKSSNKYLLDFTVCLTFSCLILQWKLHRKKLLQIADSVVLHIQLLWRGNDYFLSDLRGCTQAIW